MSKFLQLYPLVYPDDQNPSNFKAGKGWLKRFKDSHGVNLCLYKVNPFQQLQTELEKLSKIMEEKSLTVMKLDCTGSSCPAGHLLHHKKRKLRVSKT